MPEILFYDGFQQYGAGSELAHRWATGLSAPVIGASGRSNGPSIVGNSQYPRDGIAVILDAPKKRIGMHFRMRASGFGIAVPIVAMGGKKMRDQIASSSSTGTTIETDLVMSDTISLTIPSTRYAQLHNVLRASAGKNALLLGAATQTQMQAGQLYSVEIVVDLDGPTARAILSIDGVIEVDQTFDPTRLVPAVGFTTDVIEHVTIAWPTSTAAYRPAISDVVIYEPDAGDLAPLGPLAVDYVYADGFGRPITNNSGIVVPLGDSVIRDFVTAGSDIGPVHAARLITRTLPGVVERPYSARVSVLDAGDSEVASVATGRIDSSTVQFREADVPGITQLSDIAALRLRAESL